MIEVLKAVAVMGGLGLTVGIGLALASKIFYVYVDPMIEAVDGVLPGANCGGCGMPGCGANAEAIVAGKAAPNSCVAAGPETAEAIAAILGVSVEAKEPDIARPGCTYGTAEADTKYVYDGLQDCRAAALLSGGMKVCTIGCIGLGSCVKACQFGALSMGPDQLPKVDPSRCTGCGACERACPKDIINLSSVTRRIIREYTTADCTTPCQRACPAGIDISEYIRQIAEGDFRRALQVIKERNPFPTVIGRICPRPCENDCRRQLVDEPVAINFLKRFVADYERSHGERVQPYKAPDTGRTVAVIGGGVEGLSTAFFAARLGHAPTVFEATDRLGGLLRSAIAHHRLPPEILDWDIQGVQEMGVTTETGKVLGRDVHIADLLAGDFEAVFLATGGWDSRLARGAEGAAEQAVPGTALLMDVLRSQADGGNGLKCQGHTILVDGGDLALDAAPLCLKLGAQEVTVMFSETEAAFSGDRQRLETLTGQGVKVLFGCRLTELAGEDRRLTAVAYRDGQSGETVRLEAGAVVFATGRVPEMIFVKVQDEEQADDETTAAAAPAEGLRWSGIAPVRNPMALQPGPDGLLAGNAVNDFSAAIKAIGAGRRGAVSLHQVIYGLELDLPEEAVSPTTYVQNVNQIHAVVPSSRRIMPVANPKELAAGTELEKGFDETVARSEAQRCLQCGLICYRHDAPPASDAAVPRAA